MRPVVFGPSPLMEAALGVFKGQALGREREAAAQDRADELAKRKRGEQLDALTIAQRTIANDTLTTARSRDAAQQARADADALELRTSEVNADGRFGRDTDPADKGTDYRGILTKERKIAERAKQLMAAGHPADLAWDAARRDQTETDLQEQAAKRRRERELHEAKVANTKALTALNAARAVVERASGGKDAKAKVDAARREDRDRRREFQSLLTRRPKQSQFMDAPGLPNVAGYEDALTNWRADSTERKGAADDAAADLRALVPGLQPVTEPTPAAGNPAHQALALEAQDAIARIMASTLPDAEKQARVRAVKERLSAALQSSR